MNDEFTALRESVISAGSPETSENRVVAAIADLGRYIAERDAEEARESEQRAREAAERDRQIHNHITIGIGLVIGAITIATAVISIVIVVID